jgi:hypothetical protein
MWIDSDISVAVVAPWSVRWCWERGVAGGWLRYGGCQAQMVTAAAANAVNASSRRVGWASGVARTSRSIWAIHLTPLVAQLGAVAARTSVLDTCWIRYPRRCEFELLSGGLTQLATLTHMWILAQRDVKRYQRLRASVGT